MRPFFEFREKPGENDDAAGSEEQDGPPGAIVNGVDGFDAFGISGKAQVERTNQVPKDCQADTANEESDLKETAFKSEITDEERGHDGGLQTADTAAGFVHSDGAVGQVDKAAEALRRDAEHVQHFDIYAGHFVLEAIDDG